MTKLAVSTSIPNLSSPSKRNRSKYVHTGEVLLSDVSDRDRPWDIHKDAADIVGRLYRLPQGERFKRLAERIFECSQELEYALDPNRDTGEVRFRLKRARFCRVRFCPICQWRRSLMWKARFMKYVMVPEFPKGRWLHLTLTVENMPLNGLRAALQEMNRAWERMIQRKNWPGLGFIRSTEITRAKNDFAHPHFHVLLYVSSSYFGRGYITHAKWVDMWREALRVDYDPSVKIQAFKLERKVDENTGEERVLPPAEILKYAVKPCDLIGDAEKPGITRSGKRRDAEWLALLTIQTQNLRFISTGGVLKNALQEEVRNDELLCLNENPNDEVEELERCFFYWLAPYYRLHNRNGSRFRYSRI